MPVSVGLTGTPAAGYTINQVSPNPLTVTLRGAPSVLADVSEVATAPISVNGLAATRTFTADLVLPPDLLLAQGSPATVSVEVAVSAAQASRTFLVGVTCTGASAGTTCLPQTDQIAITLSGTEPALAALQIAQITPVLNVSGLAPGSHDVTPSVTLPDGISLLSFSPPQVTVLITQPSPSPSPGV